MAQARETQADAAEESWFEGADGVRLFARSWLARSPRAAMVLVHGFAEHSGRYEHVGAALAAAGFEVHAFDLRGHGRSDGPRATVRTMDQYLDDLDRFLAVVRGKSPGVPLFVLGHSMGGAIVALHAIERRPDVRGVLLSGAALTGGARLGVREWIIVQVGRLFPGLPLVKLAAASVSRDPEVVRLYDGDPLNYRGRIKAGLASAMIRGSQRVAKGLASLQYALLIMHGSDDALAPVETSEALHAGAGSRDKTLKVYEGLYHEILNEPERGRVLADIVTWVSARA